MPSPDSAALTHEMAELTQMAESSAEILQSLLRSLSDLEFLRAQLKGSESALWELVFVVQVREVRAALLKMNAELIPLIDAVGSQR